MPMVFYPPRNKDESSHDAAVRYIRDCAYSLAHHADEYVPDPEFFCESGFEVVLRIPSDGVPTVETKFDSFLTG